ncbi:MAG: NAD-dependent epimerase/dehydratase family protein [Chitinophagaceae bacterium]
MENDKILVTGGTGLLGGYLLRALIQQNKKVTALYREQFPTLLTKEEIEKVNWVQGDILDISCLQDTMTQCTHVYHCAGMVSFNPSKAEQMMKVNAEGTANVVNISLECGIKKMVHVSSVAALGKKRNHSTINERIKLDEDVKLTAYGNSKYQAEMEVWRGISEGLDAVIVNPSIILGVGNWHKGSAAMFKNAYQEFPWYTEGTSGYVDAMDVAKIMTSLMDSEISAERFILSGENRSYKDIFTQMALAFGKKPPHKKASPFLSGIVWRLEKIKSIFSSADPLLTRETAETAQMLVAFDNSKILNSLPAFTFRPIDETIAEYCREYLVKMNQAPQ